MNATMHEYDSFSLTRMLRFGKFYLPTIKIQLLIYFGVAILSGIITLLPLGFAPQLGLFSLIWIILPFLVQAAPCAFAQKGYIGPLERMMPVSPMEKFLFYIIYFCVVIPVVLLAIPELSLWVYLRLPYIQTEGMLSIVELHFNNPVVIKMINMSGAYAAIITSLYVVARTRTNRVLKGILSVLAVMFGIGVIGMIYGLFFALPEDLIINASRNQALIGARFIDNITSNTLYITASILIIGGYSLCMTILFYRLLTRKDI